MTDTNEPGSGCEPDTGREPNSDREPDAGDSEPLRTATVRTRHTDATLVRAALAPDNTDSMGSHVDGDVVETTIERTATGGLRSSVDDYVVNLAVADSVIDRGHEHLSASQHDTNT